ncbi:hypothetical protein niasHS_014909 [Heterodera schachtii]|uniref:Uncharacterized protein n=1 Tax=Heterodera schachtii TaxID=97005 RepID=A0ABD2IL27_HETSC
MPFQQIEPCKLPSINKMKMANALGKVKRFLARQTKERKDQRQQHKKVTIKERIHPRYLELEPLCCVSSCLVRMGCCAVAVFQLAFVASTTFVVGFKIYAARGRPDAWHKSELEELGPNALITHRFSLYLLGLFDLITLFMSLCLFYGIYSFKRVFVKMHWRFDFFALGFNAIVFFLFLFALNSEGPEKWSWENVLLLGAFASQIPLQIWAISVLKACYDFYVLLYVFVSLCEK